MRANSPRISSPDSAVKVSVSIAPSPSRSSVTGTPAGQRGVRQRIGVRRQVFRQRRAPQSGEQRQQHGKGPLQSHRDHLLPLDARRGEKVPQDGIFRRSGKAPQGGICRRAAVTPGVRRGKASLSGGIALRCAPPPRCPARGKSSAGWDLPAHGGRPGVRRGKASLSGRLPCDAPAAGKVPRGRGGICRRWKPRFPVLRRKRARLPPPHQTAPRRKLRLPRRGDRLPRAAACASRGAIRSRCPSARRARTGPPPRRGTSPRRRRW